MTIELYDQGDVAVPPPGGRTPAYSSFRSFLLMLDSLQENGLPAVLDRSFFGSASGGLVAQTRGTLRFLELIDDIHKPTEALRLLVEADDERRRAMLRRIAEDKYAEEIKLAEQSGTYGQLLGILRERGLSGATGRKAATFYTHLADYAALPVSPYFTQTRASSTSNAPARKQRRKKPVVAEVPPVEVQVDPVTVQTPAATSHDAQKAAYISMLMDLAKTSGASDGGPSPDLLDRIERMLGSPPPQNERAERPEGGGI